MKKTNSLISSNKSANAHSDDHLRGYTQVPKNKNKINIEEAKMYKIISTTQII